MAAANRRSLPTPRSKAPSLIGVDPQAWLTSVLGRIAEHKIARDRRAASLALRCHGRLTAATRSPPDGASRTHSPTCLPDGRKDPHLYRALMAWTTLRRHQPGRAGRAGVRRAQH